MKQDGGLRSKLHLHVRGCQWSAVETGMTTRGVPDSEYAFPGGVTGWVECKRLPRGHRKVIFRPGQVAWAHRRRRMGGRCFVLVISDTNLSLYDGVDAAELERGDPAVPLGAWPVVRVDWTELADLLRR